jgi:rare lipoprotein A
LFGIELLSTLTLSCGIASWYGPGFHGRLTANGEQFNQNSLTAASKTLPFGTRVRVTNRRNGRLIIVRINDRGPYVGSRVIDLSKEAMKRIGGLDSGVVPVCLNRV